MESSTWALDEAVLVDGGAPERRVFSAESAIFRRKGSGTDPRRRKKKLGTAGWGGATTAGHNSQLRRPDFQGGYTA